MSILVIGDAIRDRWVMAERSDRPDPSTGAPIHRVVEERRGPGGAAMVAAMVFTLGERVEFLTAGSPQDESCILPGIRVWALGDHKRPTPIKERIVIDGIPAVRLDRERVDPVSGVVALQMLRVAMLVKSDLCVVADYGKGAVTPVLARKLVDLFGSRLIVDPAPGRDWSPWRGAGVIKCNAKQAAGRSPRALCCEFDLDAALVTQGASGVKWCHRGHSRRLPGNPVVEVDATGCGDQFLAALAVEMSRGSEMLEAIEVANELAARQATQPRIKPVEAGVYAGHH